MDPVSSSPTNTSVDTTSGTNTNTNTNTDTDTNIITTTSNTEEMSGSMNTAIMNMPTTQQLPTINLRLLLALPEAAKIIGTKGSTIAKIRTDNNVKIGISEKVPGCSDRILSCAGTIINVSNSFGDVVSILNRKSDLDPADLATKKYPFHFLNHILPPPSIDEINNTDNSIANIGTLRLIIMNTHLSSIIGRNGSTIKHLIEKHGVKIVASKDFLPDSNERILEIQGFPGSITNTLIEICEILINDVDITFATERRYYPHLRSSSSSSSSSNNINNNNNNNNNNTTHNSASYHNNNSNSNNSNNNNYHNNNSNIYNDSSDEYNYSSNNNTNNNNNTNDEEFTQINLLIPEEYVGAIVGRQGNRIANLRKYTRTKIIIQKNNSNDNDDESQEQKYNENGEPCRVFTIVGNIPKQVKLAESLLLKNVETEIERRTVREQQEISNNSGTLEGASL